jgi:long-chain-fatty-acid--[acyl-carrier-protein] ligase
MRINFLHRLVIQLFSFCVRWILKLRYRVQVEGLEEALALKGCKSGILFLPNHPAEIDPVILMSILSPSFVPKSVVVEHFYHLKGFQWILDLARVVPLPSMAEKANQWRGKELAKTFERIETDIAGGENYIIYPSGKLKRTGLEQLGGSSFVYNLLQEKPDIPVVLVRTTGLWGSSFSVAQTGATPRFQTVLKKCVKVLWKNGLFFVPKRDVLVEFKAISQDLPLEESRLEFNRHLEKWYNQYPFPGEEPYCFVPYYFWNKEEEPISPKAVRKSENSDVEVSSKIKEEVTKCLSSLASVNASSINQDSHLSFDLGLDSLDIAQVHLFLDKTYGISDVTPGSLMKVRDIYRAILEEGDNIEEIQEVASVPFFSKWKERKTRNKPAFPGGKVLIESFLLSCERMGSSVACADRSSGVLSYSRLKKAVCIFYQKIKDFQGGHVAILLPSSVGAHLSSLAILLSGKVPVMLNWTAGKIALAHALKMGQFKTVLTSKKFLDKIQLEDLSEIEDLFVFLEDLKASISLKEKLKGLILSLSSAKNIMKKLEICQDPDQRAVLLFTSGTESLPKAVPLTHAQLLTNQQNSFNCVEIFGDDIFYGVLPPFHSFGFSLTGLLPLIFGIKIFYAPDPTASRNMALDIEEAKITVFCSAPSFVRSLLSEAKLVQLESLRLIVVGAERMPNDLQEFIADNLKNVSLIEGYGITECAPVVTLQTMAEDRRGVGQPIKCTKVCIVDPITLKPLDIGKEGEVCISGPCVFDGYLGESKAPFFYEGKTRWYRSGDLGRLDEDNYLILTDRIKRMMKIGAEMVSLGGIETELLRIAKEKSWYSLSQEGSPLAVIARDTGNQKAEIVLFVTFDVSKELINQSLRETGFGRIVKISEIIQVDEIPLSGTGKVHHRLLEERFKEKKEACPTKHTS